MFNEQIDLDDYRSVEELQRASNDVHDEFVPEKCVWVPLKCVEQAPSGTTCFAGESGL